jgi:arylsulfatase
MSGRHEFRNGVTHTIYERERMALSTTTFPQLLQKAGYTTGIFGKWHLGDEDAYQPYNRGFGEVFIHGGGGIGQEFAGSCADFPPNKRDKWYNRYFDNVVLHNDTIVQTKGFCTDVFFQAALGWIKKQQESKTPFFAYLALNAPHGPMIAPDKYKKRFLDAGYDEKTAARYGMIENIDDNFGVLITKLRDWNALENTLVIFMTDNGQCTTSGALNGQKVPLFNGGFKSGKASVYEGGTHVPCFWSWQGVIREGIDVPALTAHIDIFKTFCDLAGANMPSDIQEIDGRSLLPLLENPQAAWPDRELFIHTGRWEKTTGAADEAKYKSCAVRTQQWRFVNNSELYDITKDPYETTDVASQHPEVVAKLRQVYEEWWAKTRPLMVNEDVPLAQEKPQAVRYEKQLKERGIPDWQPPSL